MTIQDCQRRIKVLSEEVRTSTSTAMRILCLGEIERLSEKIRKLNGIELCIELEKEIGY